MAEMKSANFIDDNNNNNNNQYDKAPAPFNHSTIDNNADSQYDKPPAPQSLVQQL